MAIKGGGKGISEGKKKKKHLKEREGREEKKKAIGETAAMVLACFSKHVSESLPPANIGKFSKLLRR